MTKLASLETIKRRRMGLPPIQYTNKFQKKKPSNLIILNNQDYQKPSNLITINYEYEDENDFLQKNFPCNINIRSIFAILSIMFIFLKWYY